MRVLDPLAFAVSACRLAAPDDVRVASFADVDAVDRMPLAVVQTTSPASVRNGPIAEAVTVTISVTIYVDGPDDGDASRISRQMFAALCGMARTATPTEHGRFVHVFNDSQMPARFPARMEADNLWRWDFTLRAVVRPI